MAAAAFVIFSTTSTQRGYSPGQLVFGCGIIIRTKHRVDWESIRHGKKTQMNRDNTHENKHRVDYDSKSGDEVMLTYRTE